MSQRAAKMAKMRIRLRACKQRNSDLLTKRDAALQRVTELEEQAKCMEETQETLHGKQRVDGEVMAALQSRVREAEDWLLESREQWKELEGKVEVDHIAAVEEEHWVWQDLLEHAHRHSDSLQARLVEQESHEQPLNPTEEGHPSANGPTNPLTEGRCSSDLPVSDRTSTISEMMNPPPWLPQQLPPLAEYSGEDQADTEEEVAGAGGAGG